MEELIIQIRELLPKDGIDDELRNFLVFKYYYLTKDETPPSELLGDKLSFKSINMFGLASALSKLSEDMKHKREENKESIIFYENILDNTIKLAEELSLTTSLEISILYTYLLWNGYYSVTGRHVYDIKGRALIPGLFSFDVMCGGGVCLNYSEMLRDVLNKSNYQSALLVNKFSKKVKREYIPNIEILAKNPSVFHKLGMFTLSPLISKFGNHAFVLISEKNGKYIFDPTNLMVFGLDGKNQATNIVGKGNVELKTMFSYFCNDESSMMVLDSLYFDANFNSPYGRYDIITNFEDIVMLLNDERKLLEDFHRECMPSIKNVFDCAEGYKREKNIFSLIRR